MFSKLEVAAFINLKFEPVWQSVRPVPIVRIDFGNGTVLTRTLHGNIATYLCTADGQVLDILPGIYTPATYLVRLDQFRLLANYVDQQGKGQRDARLREYHQGQLTALAKNEMPVWFLNMADMFKGKIEGGLKAVLVKGGPRTPAPRTPAPATDDPKFDGKDDLANWKLLAEDTTSNETVRRKQIHEMLVATNSVRPEQVTKKLYKDILHADLDDPYLGLGRVLFANDPFKGEVAH